MPIGLINAPPRPADCSGVTRLGQRGNAGQMCGLKVGFGAGAIGSSGHLTRELPDKGRALSKVAQQRGLCMGRCLFARGRGVAALALSIVSVLSLPSVAGPQDGSLARSGGSTAAATSTDIEAASTLDLTGLQSQFSQVAD